MAMKWGRRNEKERDEAKPKYKAPGRSKAPPKPSPNNISETIVANVLDRILKVVPQYIRDQYEGETSARYHAASRETRIAIRLKHRTKGHTLKSAAVVTEEQIAGAKSMQTLIDSTSIALARDLSDQLFSDETSRVIEVPKPRAEAKKKKKKVSKPKPVCPICGPEDSYYPPWEGLCIHD